MKKDKGTQFLCKDCEKYSLCEYYHCRKEDSYICKYFHLPNKLDKIRAEIAAITINGQVDEHTMFIRSGEQVKQMSLAVIDKYKAESEAAGMKKAKRVPFNDMFAWDEWCPEYYCSRCKTQIATNKTDAEKLDRCPHCKAKFEEAD